MRKIKVSNPTTVDEYKANLQTLLLLAESKNSAGLEKALKGVSKAFENERKIIDKLIIYLQCLEKKAQEQYYWMAEHEVDEELCSEFYADKIMAISCIRQKIHNLNEIRDSIVGWEQSYSFPKLCPKTSGDK